MLKINRIIDVFFGVLELLIFIRILFSFLRIGPYNIIGRFIYDVTEPMLGPIKGLINSLGINTGMFDFSPLIAVLILRLISNGLKSLIL